MAAKEYGVMIWYTLHRSNYTKLFSYNESNTIQLFPRSNKLIEDAKKFQFAIPVNLKKDRLRNMRFNMNELKIFIVYYW